MNDPKMPPAPAPYWCNLCRRYVRAPNDPSHDFAAHVKDET